MTQDPSNRAVAALTRMADSAFEGQHWHATMRNVNSLRDDDWDWKPVGGERTIRELVSHIGTCKVMFANQLFGDASLDWGVQSAESDRRVGGSPDEAKAWLGETHQVFRDGIARLADADLDTRPVGYWDKPTELQWSIEMMIQHEVYHAGEINHIRALHHGNDEWGTEPSAEDLA